LREGLGLAAIEGMACGLSMITSNVHGINDYSENGVTGYKCSPYDVDGFAEAISKLITDKEALKKMSEQNKKFAERYSINEILPRMNSIYEG
jgi:glycosyltransferase involved in cell wall biosynthesis